MSYQPPAQPTGPPPPPADPAQGYAPPPPPPPGAPGAPGAKSGVSGAVVALIAVLAALVGALGATVIVLAFTKSSPAPTSMSAPPSPSASASSTRTVNPSASPTQTSATRASTPNETNKVAAAALTSGDRSAFVSVSRNERIGNGLFDLFRTHWRSGPYSAGKCQVAGLGAKCEIYSGAALAGTIEIELDGERAVIVDAVVQDTD